MNFVFEPDTYLVLGKLLKERSLTELMDKELDMVRDIKALNSDMQTLVYENYNKLFNLLNNGLIKNINKCLTLR